MKPRSSGLAGEAYERIEERIVTLKLPPGHPTSEGEIAAGLGIGRTPVREALQRLVMEHLVVSIPRKGLVIAEINIGDFMSLLQTRQILDQLLVSQAVQHATPALKSDLQRVAAEMTAAAERGDISLYMRMDRQFDTTMFDASRNQYATQVVLPLHAHSRRFWYYYRRNDDLTEPAKLHTAIMKGIFAGDEAVATAASDKLIEYMVELSKEALGFS